MTSSRALWLDIQEVGLDVLVLFLNLLWIGCIFLACAKALSQVLHFCINASSTFCLKMQWPMGIVHWST